MGKGPRQKNKSLPGPLSLPHDSPLTSIHMHIQIHNTALVLQSEVITGNKLVLPNDQQNKGRWEGNGGRIASKRQRLERREQ